MKKLGPVCELQDQSDLQTTPESKAGRLSKTRVALLVLLPVLLFFISLFIGRPVSPETCIKVLLAKIFPIERTWDPTIDSVIWDIRIWRALLAMLIGAGLSISGASFQGMFQNPLVSPDILGVSAAAGKDGSQWATDRYRGSNHYGTTV